MNQFNSFPFNKNELSLVIFNSILQNDNMHFYFKDLESKFILLSKKQANHLGVDSPEEAIGKTDFDFFSEIHAKQAYNDEQRIIATGQPILNKIEVETWDTHTDNYVITSKYPLKDEDGNIIGTWGHTITLEALQHSKEGSTLKALIEEHIDDSEMSTKVDQLTKLKNVKAFFNALNLAYQTSMNRMANPDKDLALMMIDIEGFSTINEDYGHHGGDSALVYLARLLESAVGNKENIYMYGTNAFAILMDVSTIKEAITKAEEILAITKEESFQHEEWDLMLNLNIGICTFREVLPLGTIYDIINLADGRLAEAKKHGSNYIVYERS